MIVKLMCIFTLFKNFNKRDNHDNNVVTQVLKDNAKSQKNHARSPNSKLTIQYPNIEIRNSKNNIQFLNFIPNSRFEIQNLM